MLPENLRPVWAEINMDHAAFNIRQIQKKIKDREIIGIVKADAYGHGAVEYARILLKNGVRRLAVAMPSEAVSLRENGITDPIIVLYPTPNIHLKTILEYDITPVISSYPAAEYLCDLICKSQDKSAHKSCIPKEIFVALDTGMGHIGFLPDEDGIREIERISKLKGIRISAILSHFAAADEADKTYSHLQLDRFNHVYEALKNRGVHIPVRTIANSAGVLDLDESLFEAVRPGIIIYGCYPSEQVDKTSIALKPVMTIKADISHIKTVPPGTSISYGCTFTTDRQSIIATLPFGYADGYPRYLSGNTHVIIRGKFAPIVGKICMDQCMADITDIPGVKVGDEVILLGTDGNLSITAEELGLKTNTVNYEILSRIGNRIPRVYIEEGEEFS